MLSSRVLHQALKLEVQVDTWEGRVREENFVVYVETLLLYVYQSK
jgi:hypothetical protein